MDANAKAKFILALHKHSLQAFDAGGIASGVSNVLDQRSRFQPAPTPAQAPQSLVNPMARATPGQSDSPVQQGPMVGPPSTAGVNQNAVNPNQGMLGGINGWLGLNNNFQASGANVQGGASGEQLNNAYSGVQQGLQGQQQFLNQAAGQGGFTNQNNILSQQQDLANQYQRQANGQGPNPAQSALNQATGQNMTNQAALMASQRGASSNAGLIARQAAQQGAATQQQAVGQGATLQAQQQLAAQSALGNQQAQMQGVAANQIAAQGQGATNLSSAQQNEQNILQGANSSYNNANVSQQGNINNVNSQTAAANQNSNSNTLGALKGVVSHIPIIGSLFGASGGEVRQNRIGNNISTAPQYPMAFAEGGMAGPMSFAGQWLNSNVSQPGSPSIAAPSPLPKFEEASWAKSGDKKDSGASSSDGTAPGTAATGSGGGYGLGGADYVNELGGSGGVPMSGELSMPELGSSAGVGSAAAAPSLMEAGALALRSGGKVKAPSDSQRAVKKDNSYANDKIPAMLSEGEIVLPRSVTMHKKAPEKAAEFVRATLAKKRAAR